MKKLVFIILLITHYSLLTTVLHAQNIVPNPSFEYYTQCPNNISQLNFSFPWQNPTSGSPDYFNACDITQITSVPNNGWGYQYAHTSVGYSGIYCYNKLVFSREYIQVQLKDSLKQDTSYCVSFYVSLADKSDYAVNNLGAYFSDTAITSTNYSNLPYIPQVANSSNNPLTNKTGWTKVSGSFIASGGEQYITIGNFNDDTTTDTVRVDSSGWAGSVAYYYIDDVSVYPCNAPVYAANAGASIAICKGDSAQIGSTPHAQYLYSWQPATGLSDTSIANPKASPAVTTTYYLHQKDFKFDETTDSVTVTVKPIPVITASASPANICSDSSSTLTAAGTATAYSWSNGSTGTQITVFPITTTAYTVMGTSNYGCTNTFSLTITVRSCEDTTETIFNVYPTLASDLFYLKYSNIEINNTHFELIDVCGRKVEDVLIENATGKRTMTTATIASGMYIYRLVSNSKTLYTGKILVIKLK